MEVYIRANSEEEARSKFENAELTDGWSTLIVDQGKPEFVEVLTVEEEGDM
jgi:hypothetical protein